MPVGRPTGVENAEIDRKRIDVASGGDDAPDPSDVGRRNRDENAGTIRGPRVSLSRRQRPRRFRVSGFGPVEAAEDVKPGQEPHRLHPALDHGEGELRQRQDDEDRKSKRDDGNRRRQGGFRADNQVR